MLPRVIHAQGPDLGADKAYDLQRELAEQIERHALFAGKDDLLWWNFPDHQDGG